MSPGAGHNGERTRGHGARRCGLWSQDLGEFGPIGCAEPRPPAELGCGCGFRARLLHKRRCPAHDPTTIKHFKDGVHRALTLLIPAAKRVLPGGEAVGIDIQPKMIERLKRRAHAEGVTNLATIVGDATNPLVPEASCDIVFLCTALSEIPNRNAALAQCYRALKPKGVLSISEMFGDPHYQTRSVVRRLADEAGFRFQSVEGGWWLYTANFVKP
jgi:SAM-dependent methyltransferase